MRFRPCIDIHNGKVKQIVGGTLTDEQEQAITNFSSDYHADYYAKLYQKDGLTGGHVILLNSIDSPYYEQTKAEAFKALQAYPKGLQVGGGITAENAREFLDAGASHVIVTSYIFHNDGIRWEHLAALVSTVGKKQIVIDLSCRRKGKEYYIVTNRWQTYTKMKITQELLEELSDYCDEFLIHGVDMEGTSQGIEQELVKNLSRWKGIPITYAGGIGSMKELEVFRNQSMGRLDFTIGSALDLFGGTIPYINMLNSTIDGVKME
ncbi:MAG: phosphoribosylformimino-5-aminoimidazole carboxamide ribotide isomerase [Lachnospiraceae bacterium]